MKTVTIVVASIVVVYLVLMVIGSRKLIKALLIANNDLQNQLDKSKK
jgi:hypothetical protein